MNTNINYQLIGKRIRDKRLEMDMSQEALSDCAGIAARTLSFIESGKVRMTLGSLLRIAHVLDVTVDELIYGSLEHAPAPPESALEKLLASSSSSEQVFLFETIRAIKTILRDHKWHF